MNVDLTVDLTPRLNSEHWLCYICVVGLAKGRRRLFSAVPHSSELKEKKQRLADYFSENIKDRDTKF